VLRGLESATTCLEDMDEWLGMFNVKLKHMREDIESVSACRVQAGSIICFAIYFMVFMLVYLLEPMFIKLIVSVHWVKHNTTYELFYYFFNVSTSVFHFLLPVMAL